MPILSEATARRPAAPSIPTGFSTDERVSSGRGAKASPRPTNRLPETAIHTTICHPREESRPAGNNSNNNAAARVKIGSEVQSDNQAAYFQPGNETSVAISAYVA